jgi:hypothetical protein
MGFETDGEVDGLTVVAKERGVIERDFDRHAPAQYRPVA